MNPLNDRSMKRLEGVHQDLVSVISLGAANYETATGNNLEVTEGRRSLDRQKQLVAAGASQTLKSRHLTGHAVDVCVLVEGEARWDWPLFDEVARHIKAAAKSLDVPIVWGGDWKSLRDGPHFELDRKEYP